jgi:mannose-6-phosphate isomerase-like protein (cupin superfamily)
MPFVDPSEAFNRPSIDTAALAADVGPGSWRQALIADAGTRWVLLAWEPGFTTIPHHHPGASEVFLVLEGKLALRLDNEPEIEAGPGTVLLARRNQVHTLRSIGEQRLLLIASVAPNESRPDETIEVVEDAR